MNRITIALAPEWVLSCASAQMLPADAIASFIAQKNLGQVEKHSFTDISFLSETLSKDALQSFKEELMAFLKGQFPESAQQMSGNVTVSHETVEAEPEKEEPKADTAGEKTPEEPPREIPKPPRASRRRASRMSDLFAQEEAAEPAVPVMDRIRQLQGAQEFIALCEEIKRMAPLLCEKSLESVVTSIGYVFSVDPGCGCSTALELLAELMATEGLFDAKRAPVELTLAAPDGKENPLEDALSKLNNVSGKLVCIDISNWCDKVTDPEFRNFLLGLQKSADRRICVFRLPYLERSILETVESGLSDVMRIKTLTFVPHTALELQTVCAKLLEEKGFTVAEEAWEQFQRRLAEEKSDGLFYGINTVKKIVDDMLFLKIQSILAGTSADDTVIGASEMEGLTAGAAAELSADEQLNRLLGIDQLREKIYEIIGQIEFARQTPGVSSPAMHMRFVGNPGTGKTTVARIVGRLMKERGILSKGYFFERSGGDFIGMYVGHTAPKTLALCRDAYGSVLFIDEAYTLADMNYGNSGGYAKEAIDTLIAQMENHRDDMVVIMAGYPGEMDRLMQLNPGLAGRIPYCLEFPNYSREHLAGIFLSMVKQSKFTLSSEAEAHATAYFMGLDDAILNKQDFANARFVRNIFESTWAKTITRSQMDGSDPLVITKEDFCAATAEDEKALQGKTRKRTRPGYHIGLV